MLDDLEASEDVSFGVRKRLSLFKRHVFGDVLKVVFNQVLELEHDLLSEKRSGFGPRLKSAFRARYCLLELFRSGFWDFTDELVSRRVVEIDPFFCLRLDWFVVDPELNRRLNIKTV